MNEVRILDPHESPLPKKPDVLQCYGLEYRKRIVKPLFSKNLKLESITSFVK